MSTVLQSKPVAADNLAEKLGFQQKLQAVTNKILDDLVKTTKPRFMRLTAEWYVRGGIYTTVVVEHRAKGWKPAAKVELP